ncbi:transposase [Streptomyces olivoreticuli]|uniref:transposase n=1 Tax=Streptomyces olivoreticuli TaxID=68246 RepID=UPI001F0854A3|nr:transposase [Streptomyces olivoreticuli]
MVCADEPGPVIPRTFPPAPGWSPDGHRIKAELDYSRGPEKTWVHGGLRPADGQEITMTAASRNSVNYQQFLLLLEDANPTGDIVVVTDNLSSHNSKSTREWLEDHPRIRHTFIPVGACWLNRQEGWWRLFRKAALAGQSSPTPTRSTTRRESPQPGSTHAPNPGSEAVPHHQPAASGAVSSTAFEESSSRHCRVWARAGVVDGLPVHPLVPVRRLQAR